ncbi:hypothetical protein CXG81DRAFT_10688 [Caulochytrium protostelioides]|uniref:Eukaryotic translation initiation factor 3 subunit B n=1 Tax=Caulochytrium protostelioides TaxID=1555241 RepID=A0A4P9XAW0_9FUNG|nr:hypothetical protein CXG81DRAFT_10688 [Caulochytrium protostelioides]|eukprot:RKP02517.1 hypothetical protein CXG81DRAFT_10688 [Caulochytrium protostelioides]
MPMDEATQQSKGFMFIEFATSEMAHLAVRAANGYRMDKSHILVASHFDEIGKYKDVPDKFEPPADKPFVVKDHMKAWLTDPHARDQWAIIKGDEVSIWVNNKSQRPDLLHSRPRWTDFYVQWSPLGTYLTTFHPQGVAIWGGPGMNMMGRFLHHDVKYIDYSPNEKYACTWSWNPFRTPDGQEHHIIVWDILANRQLRTFAAPQAEEGKANPWPIFKWSHDDKYLARVSEDKGGVIQIYETPHMGLLDKKSIPVANVRCVEWSPSENMIAYWAPGYGSAPTGVTLMRIPDRQIIRTKNLHQVLDITLHWQDQGDFLLAKVIRNKTKKSQQSSLELFRCKEKNIPNETIEFPVNVVLTNVAWEPNGGSRFVVLTQPEAMTIVTHFYQMENIEEQKAKSSKHVAKSATSNADMSNICWSPRGRFCLIAATKAFTGTIEFWDTEDDLLLTTEAHDMHTDLAWDPTGRYVVSGVSYWRVQNDNGFTLWTFSGEVLVRQQNVPQFKQLAWRPRPKSLLSDAEKARIRKHLKDYTKEFEEYDLAISSKADREVVERRLALLAEWREYRARTLESYNKNKPQRISLLGIDPDVEAKKAVLQVEEVEEILEDTEEIYES